MTLLDHGTMSALGAVAPRAGRAMCSTVRLVLLAAVAASGCDVEDASLEDERLGVQSRGKKAHGYTADAGVAAPTAPDADAAPGSEPDVTSDAPVSDEPAPTCTDVCFTWRPRAAVPPTASDGSIVLPTCNAWGVAAGECPVEFACGATVSLAPWRLPVCEPELPGPQYVLVDLDGAAPVPTAPRRVDLRFTMNGGAWPSAENDTDAGRLRVQRASDRRAWSMPMPTGESGLVTLELDPGSYVLTVDLTGDRLDRTAYPHGARQADLVVAAAGAVTVDVERHVLDWRVTVDGTVRTLADQTVQVLLEGAHAIEVLQAVDGEATSGRLALQPDAYRVGVHVIGIGALPPGAVPVGSTLDLAAGTSAKAWNLATVAVAGDLRIDGLGVEPSSSGIAVSFVDGEGNAIDATVAAGTPAPFAARLYDQPYDVVVTASAAAPATVPRASAVVRRAYRPGDPLSLELTSINVAGSIARNGKSLSAVGAGAVTVVFLPEHGDATRVAVNPTGHATFSTRLFAEGRYDVFAEGDGRALPAGQRRIREAYQPTKSRLVVDVPAHELTVSVVHDGAPLPASSGSTRGFLSLVPTSPSLGTGPSLVIPATGESTFTLLVASGEWTVSYRKFESAYAAVPNGTVVGAPFTVSAAATTTLDVVSIPVTIELRAGGTQVRDAAPGKNRGTVSTWARPGTSRTLVVPATGPVVLDADLLGGVYGFYLTCREEQGCDRTLWGPSHTWLVNGVALR